MTDKISIVMPCYKGENYVADIVGDIMRQTYEDWELIAVSNGAGQEPQLEMLRRLAAADTRGRIKVLSEEIGNVSRARNIGIDAATGKWITFADQDDRITANHLQRYAEAVDDFADGEPDMVCGGITHRWQREKMERAVPMSDAACGSEGEENDSRGRHTFAGCGLEQAVPRLIPQTNGHQIRNRHLGGLGVRARVHAAYRQGVCHPNDRLHMDTPGNDIQWWQSISRAFREKVYGGGAFALRTVAPSGLYGRGDRRL